MRYQISKLTKNHKKVEVAQITADRFAATADGDGLFSSHNRINFFNDENRFLRATQSSLVASLPGTDWIVETL